MGLFAYRKNKEEAKDLIFKEKSGLYWEIKNSYKGYKGNGDEASDTLTTKILLGTLGCVPAFDRYFKKGISVYKRKLKKEDKKRKLTQNIEKNNGDNFLLLANFCIEHSKELKIKSKIKYPQMKCVDMYFWQLGYDEETKA